MVEYSTKRTPWNKVAENILMTYRCCFLTADKSAVYLDFGIRNDYDIPLWWSSYRFKDDYENWYEYNLAEHCTKKEIVRSIAYALRKRFEDAMEE